MKRSFLALMAAAAILTSCQKNENVRLNVHLTDAPAAYEEVIINVIDVKVNVDGEEESGWRSLSNVNSGKYNLLDFTNGLDTLLVSDDIPAGSISQMRLVLGDGNQVKKDGIYYDLKTPSSQQSGLKFNIHADLTEGIEYDIWIDFDANRSIVDKGNGTYSLKPVIRTFTEATSGAVKGMVEPVESNPYIMLISNDDLDTLGTYSDETDGNFMFKGVDEGSYRLEFEPAEGYQIKKVDEVEVKIGLVTDMGTITIENETESN